MAQYNNGGLQLRELQDIDSVKKFLRNTKTQREGKNKETRKTKASSTHRKHKQKKKK